MNFFEPKTAAWYHPYDLPNASWRCGYCDDRVSSTKGLKLGKNKDGSGNQIGGVYICTQCGGPSFFAPSGKIYPSIAFGRSVMAVPDDLNALYEEARRCTSQNCHTGAVLLCRKILMNIAVTQGAEEGLRFVEYVNYLAEAGYIPPNGRHWVDHIRKKGNEATHELPHMESKDAEELISFTEMLLKLIFEFPQLIDKPDET